MITIFDYGAGNLRSVQNTLDEIGAEYELVRDADGLAPRHQDHPARRRPFRPDDARARSDAGARRAARTHPRRRAVPRHLSRSAGAVRIERRSARTSAASACFQAQIRRFPADRARAAHGLERDRAARPARGCSQDLARAPVRLFRAQLLRAGDRATAATCNYTVPYTAVLESNNIFGVQFHPEKSGPLGLAASCATSWSCNDAGQTHHSLSRCHRRPRRQRRAISSDLRDAGDPVELAERYNEQGADELVFLDITASSDARDIMADVVARTARKVFIPLTVGGGIRSVADARKILHVRRRQSQRQHRRRAPSRTDHRTERGVRRAGGRAGDRCAPQSQWQLECLHARRPRR